MFTLHKKNGTIWENKLLNVRCVFWFSVYLLAEIFCILRKIQRYIIKNMLRSSRKVPTILVRFSWNLNFSLQVSGKYSNIKFHENPSSRSRVVPRGHSDTTNPIEVLKRLLKRMTEPCVVYQIICRPLKVEFRVQSQPIPCGNCGGQSGSRRIFSPNTSVFPCHYRFINIP